MGSEILSAGDNLVKSDRAGMSNGLEVRLPLLDHEILEFSWQLPESLKIREGVSKWILRQVLYRYVPRNLIDRPKMGFSVPISGWISGDLREWSQNLLCRKKLEQQGIFDAQQVDLTYKQHLCGRADHSHKLWSVLMFQAWHEKYLG